VTGPGSWPTDLSLQARIKPRFTTSNGSLNMFDINASASTTFVSADFAGKLRLSQPFQNVATYQRVVTDLLSNATNSRGFLQQLENHALGTFGLGLDFSANVRFLGAPITHVWGQIGRHTDINAVGIVPVPAGTLFDVPAPLLGGYTGRTRADLNWNILGGVLPLMSPEAISAGQPPSRMFPTYLYSKLELSIRGWSFGVEGSLNMAEVLSPQPQQLDFNKMIDVLRGNTPKDRPPIGANAFIRTEW